MKENFKKMKTTKIHFLILVLCASLGCSTMGNYGVIVPDQTAKNSFETFQMDPGMNYYYSGQDAYPSAMIGLKKEYVLDNKLWKPIKPDSEKFQRLLQGMQHYADSQGETDYGFMIKDPKGNTLGIWYSLLKVNKTVKMKGGNGVDIYTPDLLEPKGRTVTYPDR
jgi:hypothetical protein